jgi:hypothetical protein
MNLEAAWVIALLLASWLALTAHKTRRGWLLWGIGGGVLGLVATTIILGVIHAASIPLSMKGRVEDRIGAVACAILITGLLGWLLTAALRRHPGAPS